ncbi:MAG: Fic family protein [Chlorobiaceae bacterium]|jgi:Fic family protein|nr:Fic family protein [Chlorobiaceae bacterium]
MHGHPVDFRQKDEHVAIGNSVTGEIHYMPPAGGLMVRDKLANLESWLFTSEGPDPLIRMAVAHYQFEAIHPFIDGNGRTGRIFNILYLIHERLLDIPVPYLIRYLIRNKADYYRLLRAVTEDSDCESWLILMLTGLEEAALWTTGRIHAIQDLLHETIEKCRIVIGPNFIPRS